MVGTLLAHKKGMQQIWSSNGTRIPVTKLIVSGNVMVRSTGDSKVQIAFGDKKLKNVIRPQRSILERIGVTMGKMVYKETSIEGEVTPGKVINVEEVFTQGDIVKLTGVTKGKGFAGVVKRHGFHGGPRTHGQSDRERAPGSIGQRTTPGRVFPGMRMAGRMGGENQTSEVAQIVAIDPTSQTIWIRGTIPGAYNSIITLVKQGKSKEFVLTPASQQLLGIAPAAPVAEVIEEVPAEVEAVQE